MTGSLALRAPFTRYWTSAFLADLGDGVRLAAFPLLAAQLTGSPAAVATVVAVQGLPWLLIGPGVGVLVDRTDLRTTMVGVDLARAALIAALAVAVATHVATLPLIYVTAFVTGAGSTVRDTAATTAVPRLVDPADLDRANGRLVAGELVGNELAGPAIGGWLFGVAAALPFAVNAGGLGIAVLLLLTLPSVFSPVHHARERSGGPRSAVADVREGLAWLRRDREIRSLVIAVGVVAATDGAWFAILVLYVTRVLHQDASVYGFLLALGAVGGIVSGSCCAWLTERVGALRMLAAAAIAMAAAQLVLGLTSDIFLAGGVLAGSSAGFAAFNVTARSMRQRRVPTGLLGRVNSAYLTVGRGAEAAGALAGGVLASAAGIQAPMLAGVVPLLAVAGWMLWFAAQTQT